MFTVLAYLSVKYENFKPNFRRLKKPDSSVMRVMFKPNKLRVPWIFSNKKQVFLNRNAVRGKNL